MGVMSTMVTAILIDVLHDGSLFSKVWCVYYMFS